MSQASETNGNISNVSAVKSTLSNMGAIYWNSLSAFLKNIKFMNNFEYFVKL